MKKRILFVMDNLVMGGVTRVFVNLIKNLDYTKYQVDLIVLHYYEDIPVDLPPEVTLIKGDDTYKYVDVSIRSILKQKNLRAFCGKLKLSFSLKTGLIKHIIRHSRKKLLPHTYDTEIAFNDGFTQVFTANGNSTRKLSWLHMDPTVQNDSARYGGLMRNSLKRFDALVAVSNQVRSSYLQYYGHHNIHVIHNIMDVDNILRSSSEKIDFSFEQDRINLISVGRLSDIHKNYSRFIRVHKMLIDAGLPVSSYVIGDGPDREVLESLIEKSGVKDTFTLLGRKNNPFPYVKNADLFVLSSNCEGLPTVLFEALILGVPCVSTRVAGVEEILGTQYGIITEKTDEALFDGIREILSGTNLAAYRDAAANYPYSIDTIVKQIEDVL